MAVNFKELENVLLGHDFILKELLAGLHNFQTINSFEELGITDDNYTLVDIIGRVPEQAIVSLDIPSTIANISDFPLVENAHVWIITTTIGTTKYAQPMLFLWVGKTSNRIFVLPFTNNNKYTWTELTTYVPDYTDVVYGNGTVFSYRKVGNIVEWNYTSGDNSYPTQTTITQLSANFRPKKMIYEALGRWLNNASQVGGNTIRIDTSGVVSVVQYNNNENGHGMYFV